MPKPELNLFGSEKRKGLNLQIAGGPSADGAAFMPFPANPPPVQRPRVPSRTIRDVLPENARYYYRCLNSIDFVYCVLVKYFLQIIDWF